MQHLTVSERLLVVALLPALALLARESFGPGSSGQSAAWWAAFSFAVPALSIALALWVARSVTLPIRQAVEALGANVVGKPEKQPRSETACLTAVVGEMAEMDAGRARQ